MLTEYQSHVEQRGQEGLPPLPLEAEQVTGLVELLKQPQGDNSQTLLDLLIHRVPPGVDQAAYVKAGFLADVAKSTVTCDAISPVYATELLGTMMGGYNIQPLIDLLDVAA
ncbi:MAG: aconitate hydratase B, partial [Proteobacteria bacterium]|nr:aconitate hydratase B [Pseudomonadota bacterium]